MKVSVEEKMIEFENTVLSINNLPRKFQHVFSDRTDQRLWFDSICKLSKFSEYVSKINKILLSFGIKRLNDLEREEEFLQRISMINRIPLSHEEYFSDNIDMRTWHDGYVNRNYNFAKTISKVLTENRYFDVETVWPDSQKELTVIISKLKRIPNYHEVYLQIGIDARVLYDKLITFDPAYIERAKLYLTSLKNDNTYDEKKEEFIITVRKLGYIPELQECRFNDGTDMLTWYLKYSKDILELKHEVSLIIDSFKEQKKKVNIYLIPNFQSTGGNFYTICTNEGELLDLSSIIGENISDTLTEGQKMDSTFRKSGGIILKKDQEIGSVNFVNRGKGRK